MFNPSFLGQVRLAQMDASRGKQWWLHHIVATRAYLEAALSGNSAGAVAAVDNLWTAALQWQNITRSPIAAALMGEHTMLAKLLIDCLANHWGDGCTEAAVRGLMNNITSQRLLFPVHRNEFADLFSKHTNLAGDYITDLAIGDQAAFDAHFAEALKNGQALGVFTDEVFGR